MFNITKLNTMAYHPQCDGMVERFNRALKSMLHKHTARFGPQYLSAVLWAYHSTPHESTGEKSSFSVFGVDLGSLTDGVYQNPSTLVPGTVENYKEVIKPGARRPVAGECLVS